MRIEKVLTRRGFTLAFQDGDTEVWSRNGYYVSVYPDDQWYIDFPAYQERPAIVGHGGGQLALIIATMMPAMASESF